MAEKPPIPSNLAFFRAELAEVAHLLRTQLLQQQRDGLDGLLPTPDAWQGWHRETISTNDIDWADRHPSQGETSTLDVSRAKPHLEQINPPKPAAPPSTPLPKGPLLEAFRPPKKKDIAPKARTGNLPNTLDLFSEVLGDDDILNDSFSKPPPRPTPRPRASVKPPQSNHPSRLSLESIREKMGDCKRCSLCKGRDKIVFGDGNPNARLFIIADGPRSAENQRGESFIGSPGQLLEKIMLAMGLRRNQVYITHIVKCYVIEKKAPPVDALSACIPFLDQQLQAVRPEVIVTLGGTASHALLNTKLSISKLRGQWNNYRNIPVMPTLHPAYLLKNDRAKGLVWKDMQEVMIRLGMKRGSGRNTRK